MIKTLATAAASLAVAAGDWNVASRRWDVLELVHELDPNGATLECRRDAMQVYHCLMPKAETTTAALIAEYDERIAGRWSNCQLGSTRAAARQSYIDAIVDEISRRADAGDVEALAWYEL